MRLLGILDLDNGCCRWPAGESDTVGGHLFCARAGADVVSGRPYCREHESIAWRKFVPMKVPTGLVQPPSVQRYRAGGPHGSFVR